MSVSTTLSSVVGFPGVPEFYPDERIHRRQIARKINEMNNAKFNVTIDVTLSANTGATTITDSRIGFSSAVTPLMGMSLSAAVAIGAGMYCDPPMGKVASTVASIVVHHNITADADKRIRFGIFG